MENSFLKLVANSIREHWDLPAFSDYKGKTYTYADFAGRMARVALILEVAGVDEGDKVALIGRNSAGWAMDFFSILSYGAVAVPVLPDFKPGSVQHIINHSGAKVLFVTSLIWDNLDIAQMPQLSMVCLVDTLDIVYAQRTKLEQIPDLANRLFARRYPRNLRFEDIRFHTESPEELAMLSYTSGTSGFSKGVMIPYRALWSNVRFGIDHIDVLKAGKDVISILPMAHMYGLAFEVLTEVCCGVHIHFLGRMPSPRVIAETFEKYRPILIVAVPLVLEKIVRKKVFPTLQRPQYKLLLHIPVVRKRLVQAVCRKLTDSLGGNFYEVIIGGAAFSSDVEKFLSQGGFRYTTGYGMTECAPLISYAPWDTFKEGSVGRPIERMSVRIDSEDPMRKVGEIQVKGDNVMLGYYNNEDATRQAFTDDGWLRTGDLGTMDADGNIFIRGRSKNMILGANGQNIYPEEIEDQLNALPYVSESLVVLRDEKLVALIHPDLELVDSEQLSLQELRSIMQQNITQLNVDLPAYCKLSSFQIFQDEFEKTPKHSIKRFLYS
jgi:long-chain acyl-CoA synthetase